MQLSSRNACTCYLHMIATQRWVDYSIPSQVGLFSIPPFLHPPIPTTAVTEPAQALSYWGEHPFLPGER